VHLFVQLTLNALSLAGIYALVAFGIQLVFGLTGLVNFAHGAMMTLAAYLLVTLLTIVHAPFLVPALVAVGLMGAVGYLSERFLFRRTLQKPVSGFIVSLGLIVVLQNAFAKFWSPFPVIVAPPLTTVWTVAGITIVAQQVLVVCLAVVTLGILFGVIRYTRFGQALRACAEDRQMAQLLGIPIVLIISGAFVIGTAVAGIAGVLLGMQVPVTPFVGSSFVIKGFTVALVGGLGSIPGAVVGALVLAGIESYASGYLPTEWTDVYAFGLMILVLLVRPSGILGGAAGAELH